MHSNGSQETNRATTKFGRTGQGPQQDKRGANVQKTRYYKGTALLINFFNYYCFNRGATSR